MFHIIYKTTNIINGKFYIGKHKTKDLNDGYVGSGKLLKRAINKYGIDNFHTEILHICRDEKHMNLLEKILVVPDPEINYNLCEGGMGDWGYLNREYWKEKRVEHNRKYTPFKKGYSPSPRMIEGSKIGGKKRGDQILKMSKEEKQKAFSNKVPRDQSHTEETKKKIGLANKGRVPWNKGIWRLQ
jgi:hypothetical protein